jgi:hypothetical protein
MKKQYQSTPLFFKTTLSPNFLLGPNPAIRFKLFALQKGFPLLSGVWGH